MDLREFPAVLPLHFFEVELEFKRNQKPKLIPDFSEFLEETSFSEVSVAFLDGGIQIHLKVFKAFEKASFPDVEKGDGFEFFIDTRGTKEALSLHKYCHHFVFLPKEVDGIQGVEVTRFKTNDKRELATKEHLKVTPQFAKGSYTLEIFIQDTALYGYDPMEYPNLKIASITHLGSKEPNHFPKQGYDLPFKDHPSLWANIKLS